MKKLHAREALAQYFSAKKETDAHLADGSLSALRHQLHVRYLSDKLMDLNVLASLAHGHAVAILQNCYALPVEERDKLRNLHKYDLTAQLKWCKERDNLNLEATMYKMLDLIESVSYPKVPDADPEKVMEHHESRMHQLNSRSVVRAPTQPFLAANGGAGTHPPQDGGNTQMSGYLILNGPEKEKNG